MTSSRSAATDDVAALMGASPGLFASLVSRGLWSMQPHHRYVDERLRALVHGRTKTKILVIEEPPRHGKSEHVSRWLPAFCVNKWPHYSVGLASYEAKYARLWGRRSRQAYIDAQDFKPEGARLGIDRRRDAAAEWGPEGYEGGMFCAGVGGPFTGRGFHLVVVDDPIKNAKDAYSQTYRESLWDWYETTVETRLEPGGAVVVMQTRWHQDDLVGRLIKRAESGGQPVLRVRLPALAEHDDPLGREPGEALWPSRYSRESLESIRDGKSPYVWNALYQQKPTAHESVEWGSELIPESLFVPRMPTGSSVLCTVLALDPSLGKSEKADFSAYVVARIAKDGKAYVKADLQRRDIPTLVEDGLRLYMEYNPDVWAVEANGFLALRELIERTATTPIRTASVHQSTNKIARIRLNLGPWLHQDRVRFVRDRGTEELVSQLRDFPLADHDDGPDALDSALRTAEQVLAGAMMNEAALPQRVTI